MYINVNTWKGSQDYQSTSGSLLLLGALDWYQRHRCATCHWSLASPKSKMRVRKKCFISCFDKCLLSLSLLKHLHSMMRWVDGRLISFYFIRSVSVLIRGLSIFERSIQCDRRPSLSWILTATLRCTISVSRRYFVPPPLDALSFRI